MVNPEKIESIIHNLNRYRRHLDQLAAESEDTFLSDPIRTGAAKYYLQVAIESCIDIANHIISAERLRAPRDYRDTFAVLNEANIIPDHFVQTMQNMAGFRNRLVHIYWEVDDRQIHHILTQELGDFDTFVEYVLVFLGNV